MSKVYKIIRLVIVMALLLVVIIPVSVYIIASLPPVQERIRVEAERELSSLLGVHVAIGDVDIMPFNQLALNRSTVTDAQGDTIMKLQRLSAGINLKKLIFKRRIVVDYAVIRGLDGRVWRDSVGSPLNIQPIIDALQPTDTLKPPTRFDLAVTNIILRQTSLSYNVKSAPVTPGRFNPSHISLTGIQADISLPRIKNDNFRVNLRRLSLTEQSGFTLKTLVAKCTISDTALSLSDLKIELPNSLIALSPIDLTYQGWKDIVPSLKRNNLSVKTIDGSRLCPADFSCFVNELAAINESMPLTINAKGTLDNISVNNIRLGNPGGRHYLSLTGSVTDLSDTKRFRTTIDQLTIETDGSQIGHIAATNHWMPLSATTLLDQMGQIAIAAQASATPTDIHGHITANTAIGAVDVDNFSWIKQAGNDQFKADVSTENLNLGRLLNNADFGGVTATLSGRATLSKGRVIAADGTAAITELGFKGHRYSDLLIDSNLDNGILSVTAVSDDPLALLNINAEANVSKTAPSLKLNGAIDHLDLYRLNLNRGKTAHVISAMVDADIAGHLPNDVSGYADIRSLSVTDSTGAPIDLGNIRLEATNDNDTRRLTLTSEIADAQIIGSYNFTSIVSDFRDIASHIAPNAFDTDCDLDESHGPTNDFTFAVTVKDNDRVTRLVKMPVLALSPIIVNGKVDYPSHSMELNLDAPYLRNGNKLIEYTALHAAVDGRDNVSTLYLTTQLPTANGAMPMVLQCDGIDGRIDTRLRWEIEREKAYNGDISFSTLLIRDADDQFEVDVDINPSQMTFNDSVWDIHSSHIRYTPRDLRVDNFNVSRTNQHVKINGHATTDPDDLILVNLLNVNLDYIFESLGLDNVMIGGDATGVVTAQGLFSSEPRLFTDNLHVDDISYNKTVLGDADILSHWDAQRRAVNINAEIHQFNASTSRINGDIFALDDSLDIRFDCEHVNVGFLKPYTQAFCSDISGQASGKARLWGTFKLIDLEGDVLAEGVKMKIDFVNASYTASNDSIHLRPGKIDLRDITLYDQYGHTAKLNGQISHKYFKQPSFDFFITDARDFLAFDVTEKINPDWYGHILGNGQVTVHGEPGLVDINVNMSSSPESTFTFVLSDRQDAGEYKFITFRDRRRLAAADSIAAIDTTPQAVKDFKRMLVQNQEEGSSVYRINCDFDVNPTMKIVLVMDPAGGDRVIAYGKGHIQFGYDSKSEDIAMRGVYTVEHGTYNFTLQDIIIRDFTIQPGSSIAFQGDPYSALLDLEAIFATTANLSDLDESFLYDKDLNRTNVPVHAVLKVSGDMRTPDIAFDLAFPTLNNDTYRKVKSIVSTEDMMNRQIIYLLALNRFYTPDYMANTTRSSELMSVASSTISSHLGNILGQLSDKWTIAPNVRSSKGDFSDVEVDVALSSQLLNNRLIFNGNLGYRDKSLNTNQFVGDFDLEYLLNRSGNVRLKAYNRYNDQNFYIRTSPTTQGIGIIFRRDFDNMFKFLRRPEKIVSDTIPTDSIYQP